jgi:hypothetical protein
MTIKQPFYPHFGTNQVITPAAASASATIDRNNKQLRVLNSGANIGYFRTYNSEGGSQSATTADYPVAPNQASVVSIGPFHDSIAYISAAGTTFNVMTGEGF